MFITKSIKSLLDKLMFACFLLLGIQLPNFVTQYQQALSAHYQESSLQLRAYQQLADRFYAGDLNQLVKAHTHNPEASIRAEANVLTALIQRHALLKKQYLALDGQPLPQQLKILLSIVDFSLTDEVLNNYSINLPLNTQAITVGLVLALFLHFFILSLLALVRMIFRAKPRQSRAPQG